VAGRQVTTTNPAHFPIVAGRGSCKRAGDASRESDESALVAGRESCKRAGDASRESDESAPLAGRGSCKRAGDASPRVAPLANHPLHGISDVASHKRTCRVPIDGNKQSRARQEAVLLYWEATTNAPGPFAHPPSPFSHCPADPNGVALTAQGEALGKRSPCIRGEPVRLVHIASHKRTCRVPIDGNKRSRARQEAVLLHWEATTNAPGPFAHPPGPFSHSPADPNGVVLTAQGEALGKRSPCIRGEPARLVHVASQSSATCAERGHGMNGPFRTDQAGVISSQSFDLRCVWRPSWILLRLR